MAGGHTKIRFGIDYGFFCNSLNIVVAPVTVQHVKSPRYVVRLRRIVIDKHLGMMRYIGFNTICFLIF